MMLRALLLTLVVLVTSPARLPAQNPADPPSLRNTATVPESNEAMLLASQVEQAAANGEFRLALGLIEKLFTMSDELVMTPGATSAATFNFYWLWRWSAAGRTRPPSAPFRGLTRPRRPPK